MSPLTINFTGLSKQRFISEPRMNIDISDIPENILRSIASQYTMKVDELRRQAFLLWKWKGEDHWYKLKQMGLRSKNRVEYWEEQVAWGKIWANNRE